MGRFLLYLLLYALALLLGFHLRGRYDLWVYRKPHMQARLGLFSQEVALARAISGDDDPEKPDLFFPPSTLDKLALNPRASAVAVKRREDELAALLEKRMAENGPPAEVEDGEASDGVDRQDAPAA